MYIKFHASIKVAEELQAFKSNNIMKSCKVKIVMPGLKTKKAGRTLIGEGCTVHLPVTTSNTSSRGNGNSRSSGSNRQSSEDTSHQLQ